MKGKGNSNQQQDCRSSRASTKQKIPGAGMGGGALCRALAAHRPPPCGARLETPGAQIGTLNLVTWERNSCTDLFSYSSKNEDFIRCPCLVDIAVPLIPHKPVLLLQRDPLAQADPWMSPTRISPFSPGVWAPVPSHGIAHCFLNIWTYRLDCSS